MWMMLRWGDWLEAEGEVCCILSERQRICLQNKSFTSHLSEGLLIWKQRLLVRSLSLKQQADDEGSSRDRGDAASPGSQQLSSCSSWCPRMKWSTACYDQLFPSFKICEITVQVIDASAHLTQFPAYRRLGFRLQWSWKKVYPPRWRIVGPKQTNIYCPLPKSVDQATKRVAKLAACCPVEKRLLTMQTRAAMHCRHTVKQKCTRRWCRSV